MKKTISSLVITALLLLPSAAFAETTQNIDTNSLGYGKSADNAVFDTEKAPFKEFSPSAVSGEGITLSAVAPFYTAVSDFHGDTGDSISNAWTDSSQSKRMNIDHIGARSVVYLNKGYVGTNSNHRYNENQAYSYVTVPNAFFNDGEVYGYHAFEQSGFTSWYPETYGT
ncbi:hypothetical protein D1872_148100 [compost metagenome]